MEIKPEIIKAIIEAQKDGIGGIILTNTDAIADYKALIEKNRHILSRHGLFIDTSVTQLEKESAKVTVTLLHIPSGQDIKSEVTLNNEKRRNPFDLSCPEIALISRILCEGLLDIASSNDAIEADLFGPKRGHLEIEAPYDKEADYIDFELVDHTGKQYINKVNRKKFERQFLGMTSEEEANTSFVVPQFRRFSWSDIKLFMRCQRCFYNKYKLKVRLDDFDNHKFGLEKKVDLLLKKEFDHYRNQHKLHPIMATEDLLRPLKDKRLSRWRTAWIPEDKSPGGIQYHDAWENWMVYGGVDDIWLNNKKELVIVDYKCSTNNKDYPEHKQQLEFYAWILRQLNRTVSSAAYLLICRPSKNQEIFDWKLEFESELKRITIDDSWVRPKIADALKCLSMDTPPNAGYHTRDMHKKCELCDYFDRLTVAIGKK